MKRTAIALAMLAVTAWIVRESPSDDLARGRGVLLGVPAAFGDWDGRDYSFDDAVEEELQADDTLIRRYTRGAERMWLCVVYHRRKRYGAHDPRLCYESQGWILEPERRERVDDGTPAGIEANAFVARRRDERRLVWYWWTTRGLSTGEARDFRDQMALDGAWGGRSWGAFVRVESLVEDGDLPAAKRRIADFSARVARALPAVFARADSTAPAEGS